MSLQALRDALPDYARDLARNLCGLAEETILSDAQKWGCFIAAAQAMGVAPVMQAIEAQAATRVGLSVFHAAKTAAALMAMSNVYHRAAHLMTNTEYQALRAGLRMNAMMNPGAPKADYDLYCLAVSAIYGCGVCMDAHEEKLRSKHGLTNLQIQAALRIAAVVHAVSAVVRAEAR